MAAGQQAVVTLATISTKNDSLATYVSGDWDADGISVINDPIPGLPLGLSYPAIIPLTTDTIATYSVNDNYDNDGAEISYVGDPLALHLSGSWTSPSMFAGAALHTSIMKTMALRPFTLSFVLDIPENTFASNGYNRPKHIIGTKRNQAFLYQNGGFSVQTQMVKDDQDDDICRPLMEGGVQVGNYYTIGSFYSHHYDSLNLSHIPLPYGTDNTAAGPQSGFPIRAGEKTHVSLVRDGEEMRVYINGALHVWDSGDFIDLATADVPEAGAHAWTQLPNGFGDLMFAAYADEDGSWTQGDLGFYSGWSLSRIRINDIAEDAAQVAADNAAAVSETTTPQLTLLNLPALTQLVMLLELKIQLYQQRRPYIATRPPTCLQWELIRFGSILIPYWKLMPKVK